MLRDRTQEGFVIGESHSHKEADPELSGGDSISRFKDSDRLVRRGLVSRAFYAFCATVCRLVSILLFDYRCFGVGHVPRGGGAVLASNHQSYLDPVLVGLGLPRAAFYLARESLFRLPGFRQLILAVQALPIPRTGTATRRAIDFGRAVLRAGKLVVLFPEGTRSRDGRMGPVKRGVDLISRPTGSPVVPTFIDGSFEAWPRTGGIRIRPIRVFFGPPISASAAGTDQNGMNLDGADLVSRLVASYRSLEAQALGARWAGIARAHGRFRCFG
jgi:1-acyl-sn-glycerol-3-phosphate acyltransferase